MCKSSFVFRHQWCHGGAQYCEHDMTARKCTIMTGYFQVSASEDKELFQELQKLLSHGEEGIQLPNLTKIQCCLRLLYSQGTE